MDPEEHKLKIKKDLLNLTRTLTPDNLNTDEMFSVKRGIRACTPQFTSAHGTGHSVSERLKSVHLPE